MHGLASFKFLLQFYLLMKWSCKELHCILFSVLNRSCNLYELPWEGILSELLSETLCLYLHLQWISLLPAVFCCSWNEYHIIEQEVSRCGWFVSLHRIAFNRIYVAILKAKGKCNLFVRFCSDKWRAVQCIVPSLQRNLLPQPLDNHAVCTYLPHYTLSSLKTAIYTDTAMRNFNR
jgi:hypothetical protein